MPSRPPLPDLPVVGALPEVRSALGDDGQAILVAPPGAGKTTVVPLLLLGEDWLGEGRIVMLEPRRLAARAAARRMADLLGEEVGGTVGYQTRDERRIGRSTRIEVLTEGILTRRLQRDPTLDGVALVVFDEVHERNLPTDLGLALVTEVRSTIRPDLRLLAMSATPDTDRLVGLLGAPVVESTGRGFDVKVEWLPRTPPGRKRRSRSGRVEPDVVTAVLRALGDHDGDVLVFLPGIGEIRRTQSLLAEALGPGIEVHALAGALTVEEQDAALRAAAGRRRVVLATDIAETSLTVEGVRIVVDSGLVREPRFDPGTGMTRLTTVSTSRASAEQRTGRAGRTAPGAAYRLWSKLEHGTRPRHRTPELLQTDLAGFALELAAWGGGEHLTFPDPPPGRALEQGRQLLRDLRALGPDDAITPLGTEMLGLPVHPRLARMVAVDRSALACVVATLVDERDVLRGRPDELPTDLALRVGVVAGTAGHDRADRGAVHRLRRRVADLARRAGVDADLTDVDVERTGAVVLLGYPDRLASRRRAGQFQLRTGTGAFVDRDDPLAEESFLVVADLDGRRDRARIRLAAAVDVDDVVAAFGDEVTERRTIAWDPQRDDLVETVERRIGALALGRHEARPAAGEAATAALMDHVRRRGLDALSWSDDAVGVRDRVDFLRRAHGAPWPDWSTPVLLDTLDEWLAPYLPGARGRADLDALDLGTVLRSQLPWPDGARLDELAPPTFELPGGRTVRIDYSGEEPTVAARVQDLFGVTEHPHAGGRPLRLELLSPADRPLQITTDLPGFWTGSWAEVRKDMAGRYPKHHWPEDPGGAPPRRMDGR